LFAVHPQLKQDCIVVGNFPLSLLLLHKDSRFPWFILVPMREGISEVFQLSAEDRQQLYRESDYLSEQLAKRFNADKMNIAAIGNVVPQLHLHHVVRYKTDSAWPAPVWGSGKTIEYDADGLRIMNNKLRQILKNDFIFL
jgi:diadenosine tetraphosphate (Ap4A) HIT family hydrolase